MPQSLIHRWLISALAALAILYGLAVLWMITTQRSLPLGCLLTNSSDDPLPGLEIQDVSHLRDCKGTIPEVGDHIIEALGTPIRSYSDWARVHRQLRHWKIDSGSLVPPGTDPLEFKTDLPLVEYTDPQKSRIVLVWFLRPGEPKPLKAWLPLVPQPTFGVAMTLIWYVLQLCIVIISGLAYWNRPFDVPVRTFFALSAVTLAAFVGGSHWWVIAPYPTLIILFAAAAISLPAILLHFFLVYPYPVPALSRYPVLSRLGLYLIPGLSILLVSVCVVSASFLAEAHGSGPFAKVLSDLSGALAAEILPRLRQIIFSIFGVSLVYFILSLLAIYRSQRIARNAVERSQVRSLFGAALFATLPIAYTIYLAWADRAGFALGTARLPMFVASLAFMFAYAIGIARYKLMLVDQVVSRGVWYYSASAGLALVFAALIAVGAVNVLQQDLLLFGQAIPLALVLMTSVLVISWGRDAIQRVLDRRFFSEKYQLDKALVRMNRVATNVLEPEAVANSLLNSCRDVLQIDQAALYLRRKNRLEFRMATAAGRATYPLQITLEPPAYEALQAKTVLQRIGHGHSPAQVLLRQLRAEVVHGLEMQGEIGGLLVLGTRPNSSPFSAEDLAFLSAMARIASVALHCAVVQQDVARLNQDLKLKMDKIEDQSRQLMALHSELSELSKQPAAPTPDDNFRRGEIKGHGPAITQVLETVRKVAGSDASVLIRGESGTGKELLARALHDNSPRREGPLVSVHCAALSPQLLESELFGHVKGAFTDARQDKVGRFQLADGGTLFLDEIGEISLDMQVKLLRVLQERSFEPVGGTKTLTVDVRIVAATHRNLEQLISEGLFREDLFYRLNVISVTLPPLRERQDDLFELALHFLRRGAEKSGKTVLKIDDDALKVLQAYSWPGNIRELQNVLERAAVLAEGDSIRVGDLPAEIRGRRAARAAVHEPLGLPQPASTSPRPLQISLRKRALGRSQDEKETLVMALKECQGNKAEAARLLGFPRSTFFSKLKKHGLQ